MVKTKEKQSKGKNEQAFLQAHFITGSIDMDSNIQVTDEWHHTSLRGGGICRGLDEGWTQ